MKRLPVQSHDNGSTHLAVKEHNIFVDENCHPQNISVLKTRAKPLGISLIIDDVDNLDASRVFGAIFQYPGTNGNVRDFTAEIEKLHEFKAISVISADPLSLTLLKEPEPWVQI